MSAADSVRAREQAKKPQRVKVNVTITATTVTKPKPKRERIDDFEVDVPELVPSGDE